MELGFQLYSARLVPSLDDTLGLLAAIGYSHVEPYGGLYDDVERLAAALGRHGLAACSGHFNLADLDADPERMLDAAEALGIELVIVPAVPESERSQPAAGWRALAEKLERLAGDVARRGRRLAWHNHAFEFAPLGDGTLPMDLLLDGAPSLGWQVDVAWVARGGQSPWRWLEARGDRVVSLHLKDIAPAGECEDEDGWADFDHGEIDWAAHWGAVTALDTRILVAEHDRPADVERFARRAHAAAARLMGTTA